MPDGNLHANAPDRPRSLPKQLRGFGPGTVNGWPEPWTFEADRLWEMRELADGAALLGESRARRATMLLHVSVTLLAVYIPFSRLNWDVDLADVGVWVGFLCLLAVAAGYADASSRYRYLAYRYRQRERWLAATADRTD